MIIIYGSQYGATRKYAEELGRRITCQVKAFDQVEDINKYQTIIYFGGLYAGGVMGLKKTFSRLTDLEGKRILIATVGLADPRDPVNVSNIRKGMKKQLSDKVFTQASIVHLRGSIDYSCLNFKHKTMMAMLYKKAKGLPEEKKTAEVRVMIETYNQKVDFVDLNRLEEITELVCNLN